MLQMQGMIAEYERAQMLERSRRGKRHKARQGSVNVLCGAPYGYRYVTRLEGGGEAEALAVGAPDSQGRRHHLGLTFMFEQDGVWPVLKTVIRGREET